MPQNTSAATRPWWRYGHVRLVIAGPLVVVIASFVTIYLAIRTPDPVYVDRPKAAAPVSRPVGGPEAGAMTPAMQARNHAATGGAAPPSSNRTTGADQ